MFIEQKKGGKLLKRISRHEPHDPFTKINQNKLPILTIRIGEMLTQFEMNKMESATHHKHPPLASGLLSHSE